MPDISEVLAGIVDAVAAALYPAGLSEPSAVGAGVRVFPGWPDPKNLDEDLARGIVNVSLFPRPGMARPEVRYSKAWSGEGIPTPTMTATVVGEVITFTGVGSAGLLGAVVEGVERAWPLQIQTGQTPEQVASAFLALVTLDRPATVAGPTLTLPGSINLKARCVAPVPEERELRRQTQGLQVTIWAPTPALRDATASAVDIWLASTPFLPVSGHQVRLQYVGNAFDDDARQARLHRRDLLMSADYPTIQSRVSPAVSIPELRLGTAGGDPIKTIYS